MMGFISSLSHSMNGSDSDSRKFPSMKASCSELKDDILSLEYYMILVVPV